MTEAEALKRFIPILGRISTPGERATITRNILERIAGQQTSVMGVSHKHAGVLAWPNDPVKALAFEHALDAAVDAGEFVSFIHRADRRHFQIEELSAWPDCPKVDTESPLTFWLTDTAQRTAKPAPVVAKEVQSGNVLTLPNGHTHVLAGELPLLIADAQWPDDGTDDEGWEINHGTCWINSEREIKEAVLSGALPVKKSTTYAPQTFLQGNAWKTGLVTIADLQAYVAERGITLTVADAPEPQAATTSPAPAKAVSASVMHSTKARRDTLTPVIEFAQNQCRNRQDTAEVWAALLVLAEKKHPPLIGATEEGVQYLNKGSADIFKKKSLSKRLAR